MTTKNATKAAEFPLLDNTMVDIRLLGFPNMLSPFAAHISSPRMNMLNNHLSQTMVVAEPEFNKLFTGAENSFIDYAFNYSKREYDCEILAFIPKYTGTMVTGQLCPQYYVIVLTYEPNNVRRLDYFTVDKYFMGTNGFGWIPEISSHARQLRPGEFLDKDTPITSSPAVQDSLYCLGVNANIVYGSFPETIEDAFVVSESFAKKSQTQQISEKIINCRMDRRPMTINFAGGADGLLPDEVIAKFLPDIGETVRDDGALCAFRPVHSATILADTDPESLKEPLPLQDDIIYVEAGAKILDLSFNINYSKINRSCYDQAIKYDQNNLKCWEAIFNTYSTYKNKYRLTEKMDSLVRTAIYRMIAQETQNSQIRDQFRKYMKNFEVEGIGSPVVDFMQVVVTYTVPRPVGKGTKLTDLTGGKGVVGIVYPDECMPVDEFGIRADMMIDMNSPVGRNNPGQLIETGINRIGEFVRRRVQEVRTSQGVKPAHDTLLDFYRDINPNYASIIEEDDTTLEAQAKTVDTAIEFGPRVWIPPYLNTTIPTPDNVRNGIDNIHKWAQKWGVRPSPITYKSLQADGSFKQFTTKGNFSIGSKYIIQLHKIPEITAPGPASVNHIGIPTKVTSDNKNYPVSNNPNRLGEDEQRVIMIDTDVREAARFRDMLSNSPIGVQTTIEAILLSDYPTRIRRMPISNGRLAETSAIGKLFHNTTAALGVETKSTKNPPLTDRLFKILDESSELAMSIWRTDVVSRDRNVAENKTAQRKNDNKKNAVRKTLENSGHYTSDNAES